VVSRPEQVRTTTVAGEQQRAPGGMRPAPPEALEVRPQVLGGGLCVADLPPAEQAMALAGLSLGLAVNEVVEDHDFLVRGILGVDGTGLAIGGSVVVGQTARLQVLLFSCNGRGARLFGPSYGGADHDPVLVREALSAQAVAGLFAGGELGPVAGRNHLHAFTASLLVLPA